MVRHHRFSPTPALSPAMLLAELRRQTRALHARAEQAVNLPLRLKSLAAYQHLLGRFYGFYVPLEAQLELITAAGALGLDWQPRRKAPLLLRDLMALGATPEAIQRLPQCTRLPSVDDAVAALGCLYVLEGATLGGQVIRRQVQQQLGLDAERGCAFFTGYAADTGARWSEFCTVLADFHQRWPAADQQVIAAAAETFITLVCWIEKDGPGC